MTQWLDAFIDESGQRAKTAKSSDHFVMAAVLIAPNALPQAATLLADMRVALGRHPGDELHWKNLRSHSLRVRASQMLGAAPFLRITSVVVCKRDFAPGRGAIPDDDFAYMFTFRFLLERLSWLARDTNSCAHYTLAQIGKFKLSQLRRYEAVLRTTPGCTVDWLSVDPKGGRIDQPSRVEYLQLADLAASGIAQAFEPDQFGNTEQRYAEEMRPVIYRRGASANRFTSYGVKMHPWNAASKAAHAWLQSW
jgi:uncharacterized protein DUF3800